jgi:uncharacterized protein YegJ (DUF2314 family)
MPKRWGPPGGDRTWQALLLFVLGGWILYRSLIAGQRPIAATASSLMLISAVGIWFRRRWAVWIALAGVTIYAGLIVRGAFLTGWSLYTAGTLACLAWFGWQVRSAWGPEDEDAGDAPRKPMTSFALLLKEPRALEAVVLAKILSKAWGGEWRTGDAPGDEPAQGHWIVGESPLFMVGSTSGMFLVHNVGRPYFEDPKAAAGALTDARLRHAVENARGWMAVDLMIPIDPARPVESYYPEIARLIAELADDDVLAIYHPESGRLNAWASELEEKLRGPDPLRDFATPLNPPVLTVDNDDPRLQAAVAEARRRYPEFVAAFKAGDGENFSVKAPIRAGDRREFIWVKVVGFEPTVVHGELANDPVDLGKLKLGDKVEVPVEDVADWVYVRDGKPVGLFSQAAIAEIHREKRGS